MRHKRQAVLQIMFVGLTMSMLMLINGCRPATEMLETPTPDIVVPTPVTTTSNGSHMVTIHIDDGYRPYSYLEDGEAKGMYIDVLRAVFAQMDNYTVTLEPVPWPRGKQMMEQGQGFGLTPAFFHGHDWPYLYPYSLPFYTETIIAVCTVDTLSTARPNWPIDYAGLSIGNVAGFDGWGGDEFYDLVAAGQITYEEAPSSSLNILKLGAERIDCIMMEERAFDYEWQRLLRSGEYHETFAKIEKGVVISLDPVYIGYSRPAREQGRYPFQYDFMQTFDSILYQMLKSGEVDAIMDAYQE